MDSIRIAMRLQGGIDKYPAKAHARRVAEKLGLNAGIIALQGEVSQFYSNSDQKRPFRQDRYFYYLSGCNEADCLLVYNIARDVLTLYLPPVDYARYFYDGRGSTIEEALEKYDIDQALYRKEAIDVAEDGRTVTPAIWRSAHLNHAHLDDKLITLCPRSSRRKPVKDDVLRRAMDACRSVKDEHEIGLIRKANQISAAAHEAVLLGLNKCRSEADAHAIYVRTCIARHAKEQSYEPIFGAGQNASTLHYIDNSADFNDSQLLLIDAGCEWQRYASDVTRTIPLNRKDPGKWPSEEAKLLYEAVESIQEKCIKLMLPGEKFSSVALTAQHLAIDALLQLGVLKGDHQDIWDAGTWRAFFPHGLGHDLGLEVHDVSPLADAATETALEDGQAPASPASRAIMNWCVRAFPSVPSPMFLDTKYDSTSEPVMEAGNVITVEPGLYFNAFVLERFFLPDKKHNKFIDADVLKRYVPLGGVRIEDDILITKDGYENLTTAKKGARMLRTLSRRIRQTRLK